MNTRELDRLGGWDERELAVVVAQLVSANGRLPSVEQILTAQADSVAGASAER